MPPEPPASMGCASVGGSGAGLRTTAKVLDSAAMPLEHVAQGQTRFFTPGVAPDPRGILLGRLCVMTFPTLEGAVSWLRLYSAEAALDELMANLSITKARTALGSREIVVTIPAV